MKNRKSTKSFIEGLKALASLKLTVICLLLLTILVIWGTVYQADHGLYQAQQKFFHSWFFLLFGFIPLPGTILVMFVLSVNLILSIIFRIRFKILNIGNLITHLGIIILLIGGFFTFYFSQESSLMLIEGQSSSMSTSRNLWEIAVWEQKGALKDVYAIDANKLQNNDLIQLDELEMSITIKEYYNNCSAYTNGSAQPDNIINRSGIKVLKEKPLAQENSQNTAGAKISVNLAGKGSLIILYGKETLPTKLSTREKNYSFSLRRKRLPLPLLIKLMDFRVKMYPNSDIVKSYESTVLIKSDGGLDREVIVSMNKPLRFEDLTFFQSGYFIDKNDSEYSIFAVVKNSGRLLPYFSSGIIFLGMLIHFIVMMIRRNKRFTESEK